VATILKRSSPQQRWFSFRIINQNSNYDLSHATFLRQAGREVFSVAQLNEYLAKAPVSNTIQEPFAEDPIESFPHSYVSSLATQVTGSSVPIINPDSLFEIPDYAANNSSLSNFLNDNIMNVFKSRGVFDAGGGGQCGS
jgi:hypothetical protein